MNNDSTLVYLLVGITVLHFFVGLGYLLYKLTKPSQTKRKDDDSD